MSIVKEAVEYNIPHLPVVVLMSAVAWAAVFALSIAASRKVSLYPSGAQNVVEMIFEKIFALADSAIGEEAYRYYPLFLGLAFFIFVSNILGAIPGLISPTSNPNVCIGLAVTVFVYYNFQGIRKYGFGYLKHFYIPGLPLWLIPVNVLVFFIELISNFVRPFSLAIRLFCNIFSKEALLSFLAFLVASFVSSGGIEKYIAVMPFLLRPAVVLLAFLLGLVQTLIFLILSIVYIAGAVKSEH